MAHTPGPWRISKICETTVETGNRHICSTGGYADNTLDPDALHAEQCANAALVSAAPEMLEALEDLVSMLKNDPMHCWEDDLRPAILAIAKANGGVEA